MSCADTVYQENAAHPDDDWLNFMCSGQNGEASEEAYEEAGAETREEASDEEFEEEIEEEPVEPVDSEEESEPARKKTKHVRQKKTICRKAGRCGKEERVANLTGFAAASLLLLLLQLLCEGQVHREPSQSRLRRHL